MGGPAPQHCRAAAGERGPASGEGVMAEDHPEIWTYEQALEAQSAALAAGTVRALNQAPLSEWLRKRCLDGLQREYLSGDCSALARAVERCATHGVPLPD